MIKTTFPGRPSSIRDKLTVAADSYAFDYNDGWIETVKVMLSSVSSNVFVGASVIDVGAGVHNPLACSVSAIARGAIRTLALESSALDDNFLSHGLEHALLASSLHGRSERLRTIESSCIKALRNGMEPLSLAASGLHIRDKIRDSDWVGVAFDVVHSRAVIEHVTDLDELLNDLNRVTAKGALHVHEVDFIDHDYYSKAAPEEIDKFTFLFKGAKPENSTCNRLRFSEVMKLFRSHGIEPFGTPKVYRGDFKSEYRSHLDERFKLMCDDDLAITCARFAARKVA